MSVSSRWGWLTAAGVFWLLVALAAVYDRPVMSWLDAATGVRPPGASEYHPVEQLSKFVLLAALTAGILGYRYALTAAAARLGVASIILALTFYFAESNFLGTAVQLLFGLVLLPTVAVLLWRVNRPAAGAYAGGVACLGLSVFGDLWHDHMQAINLGGDLEAFASFGVAYEETIDLFGTAAIGFAIVLAILPAVDRFVRSGPAATTLTLLGLALVAVGNGYAHFQHEPSRMHRTGATAMAAAGFVLLVLSNHRFARREARLDLFGSPVTFWFAAFLVLLVLPLCYRDQPPHLNLLIWGPIFAYLAWQLHQRHPLLGRREPTSADARSQPAEPGT